MYIRGPVLFLHFPTSYQAGDDKALTFVDDALKPWPNYQRLNWPLHTRG